MWIEQRGQQHRVYWRNQNETGPQRGYQPFPTRDQAELFRQLARTSSLSGALAWLRNPNDEVLDELLGRRPKPAPQDTSIADHAVVGVVPSTAGVGDRYDARVGVTFDQLWHTFIAGQRHLEDGTADLYQGYYKNHLAPFFGSTDIGLIHRTPPLRAKDAVPGAVYVDDWVSQMREKPKRNNVGKERPGTKLSIKFIKNVLNVLAECLDVALRQRPAALLLVNPARDIKLPKTDRQEMFFLESGAVYDQLREAMNDHFRPLLDFLVGTGARFGEAAGLLIRNIHLDVEQPYVDIRVVLKWVRKKWKLGRPKTKSSLRRISLSKRLVAILRPLLAGKSGDDHVFTMVEGGPLHHGNFTSRYFRPAAEAAAVGGKVSARLRIHDLRHTHAAWLLSMGGVQAYIVQRRLGHSSITTTVDVYGHITPDADQRTLDELDRHLPDVIERDDAGVKLQLSKCDRDLPEFDIDDDDDLAA